MKLNEPKDFEDSNASRERCEALKRSSLEQMRRLNEADEFWGSTGGPAVLVVAILVCLVVTSFVGSGVW